MREGWHDDEVGGRGKRQNEDALGEGGGRRMRSDNEQVEDKRAHASL